MKYIFVIFIFSFRAFATTKSNACDDLINIRSEISITISNIANAETTFSPSGGPYKRKELVCAAKNCEVNESLKILWKYEPSHFDADNKGYVAYPDIDIEQEIQSLKQAKKKYDIAVSQCNKPIPF